MPERGCRPIDRITVESHDDRFTDDQCGSGQNAEALQFRDRPRRLTDVDLIELPAFSGQILCRPMAGRSPGLGIDLDHGTTLISKENSTTGRPVRPGVDTARHALFTKVRGEGAS